MGLFFLFLGEVLSHFSITISYIANTLSEYLHPLLHSLLVLKRHIQGVLAIGYFDVIEIVLLEPSVVLSDDVLNRI
jgi:hypothetical protein